MKKSIDEINTTLSIRILSVDTIQQTNSDYSGIAMVMATPIISCLWQHFLWFDRDDPIWPPGIGLCF